jgi:hypothetical protein
LLYGLSISAHRELERVEKTYASETSKMFIAMNRFKVIKEERKAFEDLWVTRQSHLDEVKGFQAFHLLRGPEREDHVLYSPHTIWAVARGFYGLDQIRTAPPINMLASVSRSHSAIRKALIKRSYVNRHCHGDRTSNECNT